MSSVERSVESGSDLGADGLARLDVVLRQNELEWRHITDAIAVNVVVQSTTGTCLFANRTALEYWGLKLEDVMVANYRAPVHPDDAAEIVKNYLECGSVVHLFALAFPESYRRNTPTHAAGVTL